MAKRPLVDRLMDVELTKAQEDRVDSVTGGGNKIADAIANAVSDLNLEGDKEAALMVSYAAGKICASLIEYQGYNANADGMNLLSLMFCTGYGHNSQADGVFDAIDERFEEDLNKSPELLDRLENANSRKH